MAGNRKVRIPRKARKARSGKYKFSDKKHPVEGICSCFIGVVSLILVLVSVFFSEQAKGRAGILVGVLGTAAMLFSFVGFILAVHALKKKEIHYRFPTIGTALNGLLFLFLLALYVMGVGV